jgi:PAS domain S-box-containing protein
VLVPQDVLTRTTGQGETDGGRAREPPRQNAKASAGGWNDAGAHFNSRLAERPSLSLAWCDRALFGRSLWQESRIAQRYPPCLFAIPTVLLRIPAGWKPRRCVNLCSLSQWSAYERRDDLCLFRAAQRVFFTVAGAVSQNRRMHSWIWPPEEEKRYRHLVESFAQSIWETDCSGEIVAGASSWGGFTGQSESDVKGQGWLDAVHPEDRPDVALAWGRAVAEGATYRQEYRVRSRACSDWVWTLAYAAPLHEENGKILKWIGMNIDISVRKNVERAMFEADRHKDEFIAVLAHELRNPLAPLRSGIDLLMSATATAASKARAIAVMSRQTFHITRLVDDLLDASRITTGRLQVRMEEVGLAEILKSSAESIQPAINAKRQNLVLHGVDQLDAVLMADPVRLHQAFVNILNNSAKFSPENSSIDVTVEPLGRQIAVRIRDHGRGIPESDLPNIFKLFVQSARHDRGDGLGIGLALVNDVVKLHGGSVEARRPEQGSGVEFEVILPVLAFRSADKNPPAAAVATAHAWKALRVLVVDDNEEAAEVLGALLEMEGHTIRVAHNGQQALAEAPLFLPHVIFMDIGMPIMGGIEATKGIRKLALGVRPFVIALTGWSSEADRDESRAAGCDMHLAKPADLKGVVSALSSAVAASDWTSEGLHRT